MNQVKVAIETFGCTFNKADSQIMAGKLSDAGMELVEDIVDADVIIVNTCYVKQPTENKVTTRIQKLQKNYPDKKVVVSGCMVEIDPKKLDKIADISTNWIGPHQLNKTVDVVNASLEGQLLRQTGLTKDSKVGLNKIKDDPFIHIIQICEGCLGVCSFCCTRLARGPLHSYPISEIKAEAQKAIDSGCVEIGNFRIRVGMMHPKNIFDDVDELIDAFKLPNVYKFIHLPVQTGSNKVLKEMNRRHTIEEYLDFVKKIRNSIPEITLATDIIVGYPTETDEDFQKTIGLLEEIKPNLIHLSKYRHREGALSSSLEEIPHSLMKQRSKKLSEIKEKITNDENKHLLGKVLNILIVQKGSKGGYIGKSDSYLPVVVDNAEIGTFIKVKITKTTSTYLIGEKID